MGNAPLSDDQLATYERDGYVLVTQLFDRDEIELLRETAKQDRALDRAGLRPQRRRRRQRAALAVESSGRRFVRHVQPQRADRRSRRAASRRRAVSLPLEDDHEGGPHGRRLGLASGLRLLVRERRAVSELCSVFVAVDPATRENGCLQVLRGSQPWAASRM